MLKHLNPAATIPSRVVILGAGGFIAGAIQRRLAESTPTLGLGRPALDLLALGAAELLAQALRPDDTLVFASAKAPCKNMEMLRENIIMVEAVCAALQKRASRSNPRACWPA